MLRFVSLSFFQFIDTNFESTKEDPYIGLHEKLATIRQWLKDQYIFYQVRSNLVQIINEKYVPMSLEDAKTVRFFLITIIVTIFRPIYDINMINNFAILGDTSITKNQSRREITIIKDNIITWPKKKKI